MLGIKLLKRGKPLSRRLHAVGAQGMLKVLETLQRQMRRLTLSSSDSRLKSDSFYAQANLLAGEILKQRDKFYKVIEELYDRYGSIS